MPVHDDLGLRIKNNYETIPKIRLVRRMPVVVRIDGKSFHSFTKGFKKPFDHVLIESMQQTMRYLCENIQGCVFGYTQSDEISLLLIDYRELNSQAFFDYEVQKICSITASMATMEFNIRFRDNALTYVENAIDSDDIADYKRCSDIYPNKFGSAMFDSRCFNIPKEEVTNYFYWRQLDATRNSIQMVGQANFSHKQLFGKSCNDIQDMLYEEKNINWNNLPIYLKRGSCCIKTKTIDNPPRSRWVIDEMIPIFKGDGREYIDKLVII